jgi:hypothetical protein
MNVVKRGQIGVVKLRISCVVIGHTLESFSEKPLVAACASVLMPKASVAPLHGLDSLKTSSAAHHKLRFHIVYSLPPPELGQDRFWRTSHPELPSC